MRRFFLAGFLLVGLTLVVSGQEAPKPKAEPIAVPYRLTVPKHIMVRAKINGKGPFNFILDTGAPALFVATKVADQLGLKPDENGWGNFDRFEIEGGVVLENARGIIHTPFQLEGMNGMGLAGAELHGMIGYNILARYRIEIDLTSDKMLWTPSGYEPPLPKRAGGKGGSGGGGLEVMGSIMKTLGGFLGRKATPEVVLRASLGLELAGEKNDVVRIQSVHKESPAARAGVKAGDRLVKVKGRTVVDVADVHRYARELSPGDKIELTVERDGQTKGITVEAGKGL